MKFIFVTDSHAKLRGPSSRTDNYAETVLRKFAEVGDVARKIGAEAIFHGGDLFDGPRVADSYKGDLGRLIRSFSCPMYVVPGNHDLYGHSISSLDSTSLGLFFKHGICHPMTRAVGSVPFTDGWLTVSVTGQEYHHDLDRRDPALDYYVDEDPFVDYRILIVHGMLLPQPFVPDQPCTLINDVPVDTPTSPDLILAGHYHPGWPAVVRGSKRRTQFVNPGSMLRTDAGWDNMNRVPEYLIVEVTEQGIQVTAHPFQCAEPSSQILSRAALDAAKERAATLESFRQNIDARANLQGQDLVTIVDGIVTSECLPAELRDTAMKRIEAAQEQVDDAGKKLEGFAEKPGPYHITRVEAENFQSWERLEMDFASGLNVIVGPSDNGKSAVLRAIRWCLFNEPRGSDFIRWGAPKQTYTVNVQGAPQTLEYQVRVIVTFSDGSRLTRGRTEKSAGFYVVESPDGDVQVFTGFGQNVPPAVFNTSQMPKLALTKDVERCLNLQTQHEGAFLLSDDPGIRAGAIGRLTGVQVVDAAIKELSRDITNGQRDLKALQRTRERLAQELETFGDLEQEMQTLQRAEVVLAEAGALQAEIDLITEAEQQLIPVRQGQQAAEQLIQMATNELAAEPLLDQAEALFAECTVLQEAEQQLESVRADRAALAADLQQARRVLQTEPLLTEALAVQAELDELTPLAENLARVQQLRQDLAIQVEAGERAEAAARLLEEAGAVAAELQDLTALADELAAARESLARGRVRAADREQEFRSLLAEYARTLRALGTCPTCFSPISEHVLDDILARHLDHADNPV